MALWVLVWDSASIVNLVAQLVFGPPPSESLIIFLEKLQGIIRRQCEAIDEATGHAEGGIVPPLARDG